MRRFMMLLAIFLAIPTLGAAQSLEGVWMGAGIRVIGGPDDGQVTTITQPRLLIYTDAFFMWAFDMSEDGRALLPPLDQTSDAQIGAVAREYNSVAGTYIREGATLTYNRLVALAPNAMAPENQPQVREIRLLTANRLETQFTNADGVTVVLSYRRVE